MTNYAFCRRNERPSIWERVHPFIFFFLLLLLPRQVFFAASSLLLFSRLGVYARITSDVSLSPLEGKMTSRPFLVGQREEMAVACTGTISQAAVASVATVELIYEVLANFKEAKKRKAFRLSFLSSFPASSDLSDLRDF